MSRAGKETTSRRRRRVSSSRASARARPMCWLRPGRRGRRSSSPTPSRRTRKAATSHRGRGRQRPAGSGERMVMRTSPVVGAEQPHGAGRRLLGRLEQRVARTVGEPGRVLDDHDLPSVARGRACCWTVAHLVDADRELLGADHLDVGVAAGEHGVARLAGAAPGAGLALECGRETTAALERPDPGGPVNSTRGSCRRPRRRDQRLDHRPLADQVVPDGHRSSTSTPSLDGGPRLVDQRPGVGDVVVGVGGGQSRKPCRTRWWNSATDSPSMRSRSVKRPRPPPAPRSSDGQVAAAGRRSPSG